MRETPIRLVSVSVVSMLLFVGSQAIAQPIEATTIQGDRVLLHPNGRCIPPGDKDYNGGTLNPGRR